MQKYDNKILNNELIYKLLMLINKCYNLFYDIFTTYVKDDISSKN